MDAGDYPEVPPGVHWSVATVFYPAGDYRHPPAGLVQLRVVRRGSSYARIDLGLGERRVFTRPGDLLMSLGDRPTAFQIDDGRELVVLQVSTALARQLIAQCLGALDELTPLLARPVRDPLIAEIVRRLDTEATDTAIAQQWAIGMVLSNLLRRARALAAAKKPPALADDTLTALLDRVENSLTERWTVERMATEADLPRRIFAAAFKQARGMPVHQYLMRLRADHALNLLRSTDIPLADVAHQSGFAHQAHMTRVLGQLKRVTPNHVRSNR